MQLPPLLSDATLRPEQYETEGRRGRKQTCWEPVADAWLKVERDSTGHTLVGRSSCGLMDKAPPS